MFLKACKTSHSCSCSSGRGCSCWCASLPWSTACTTPWSKILLRFLIFLHIQWSDYLVWHRCGDSQNQTFFDQWELRLLPSFILQWDESLQNWTRVVIRSPGSWAPFCEFLWFTHLCHENFSFRFTHFSTNFRGYKAGAANFSLLRCMGVTFASSSLILSRRFIGPDVGRRTTAVKSAGTLMMPSTRSAVILTKTFRKLIKGKSRSAGKTRLKQQMQNWILWSNTGDPCPLPCSIRLMSKSPKRQNLRRRWPKLAKLIN